MTVSVDLGSGSSPKNPFNASVVYGVDKARFPNLIYADLALEPIPLPDSSCDYITAFDFIEHIPRTLYRVDRIVNPFILLMNEIYRCLRPGGLFYHKSPAYPKEEVFMDPTHVNVITERTMIYFAKVLDANQVDVYSFLRPIASSYGITTSFTLVSSKWDGFHLEQVLRK